MARDQITVEKGYDVIVCGGGTSGVAAAICAAHAGASTLLIERVGSLGGQMCFSGPPGFAFAHLFNPKGEQDAAGIIEEIHSRMLSEGHALPHIKPEHRLEAGYTFSYVDPDWFSITIFEMMEEAGVEHVDGDKLRGNRQNMMVTPQDIDQQVRDLSKVVGYGINWALQDLEIEEINALLS